MSNIEKITSPAFGLWSKSKLKLKDPTLGKEAEKVDVLQQTKSVKRINKFAPIIAREPYHSVQFDLTDMSNYSKLNKGTTFLMCIIDVYTRYAWVYPLKSKTADETSKYLREWLKKIKHQVNNINIDDGNEWKGEFLNILNENKIKTHITVARQTSVNAPHKQGIVERFIRTLRMLISRYMEYNNTKKYLNVLDDIVKNYNTSPHRSLENKTPEEILKGEKERPPQIKPDDKTQHQPKNEEIGRYVRYLLQKSQFQKGTVPRWSKSIYQIKTIEGGGYILENPNTKEELSTKKYIWELQFLKDKEVININKTNEKKEAEDKVYEQDKLEKKVKRVHQIEPMKEPLTKRIRQKPKQIDDLSKKPKVGEVWSTKYNFGKEYSVIILEVKKDNVLAISKDYEITDDKTNRPDINEIPINKLIMKKRKVTNKSKMVNETKKYLKTKKLI